MRFPHSSSISHPNSISRANSGPTVKVLIQDEIFYIKHFLSTDKNVYSRERREFGNISITKIVSREFNFTKLMTK